VLIPVLDDQKHYFVGDDEVQKLIRRGEGWLASHPEREVIANRYLRHQKSLTRRALEQLMAEEVPEVDEVETEHNAEEVQTREADKPQRAADRGCDLRAQGERRAASARSRLRRRKPVARTDEGENRSRRSSEWTLPIARWKSRVGELHLETMPEKQRVRLSLLHGSLTYRDERLYGFDAAAALGSC